MRFTESEKEIEREICSFLFMCGVFCFKHESQGTYDPIKKTFRSNKNPYKINGVSDILGLLEGIFIAIEVKTAKGVATQYQKDFISRIQECGGFAMIARSVKDVAEALIVNFPNNKRVQRICKDYLDHNRS